MISYNVIIGDTITKIVVRIGAGMFLSYTCEFKLAQVIF